jgi:hypothetical protein
VRRETASSQNKTGANPTVCAGCCSAWSRSSL